MCFRLSSPALYSFSVFCSIAVRLSLLYVGCSAFRPQYLPFPPEALELISFSSLKDSTETLLCLAEHAFPRCTASLECVHDVMQDNRQGLEICVTASDLVLPHLCVCVCMSVGAICLLHAYMLSTVPCFLWAFVLSVCVICWFCM